MLNAPWWLPVVLAAGLTAVGSGIAGYFHNDKELTARVTAVEIQQQNDSSSIHRVEQKVDRVDSKLDRILGWVFEAGPKIKQGK